MDKFVQDAFAEAIKQNDKEFREALKAFNLYHNAMTREMLNANPGLFVWLESLPDSALIHITYIEMQFFLLGYKAAMVRNDKLDVNTRSDFGRNT